MYKVYFLDSNGDRVMYQKVNPDALQTVIRAIREQGIKIEVVQVIEVWIKC